MIFTIYSVLMRLHLQSWSSTGLLKARGTLAFWNKSSVDPSRCFKAWGTSPLRSGWESWELELLHLEKRRFKGISSMSINTWRESVKKMESGPCQWCPVSGQMVVDTNTQTLEVPSAHQQALLCCVDDSQGTGCSERWWSLLLRDLVPECSVRSHDPQRSLLTSTILWLCFCVMWLMT